MPSLAGLRASPDPLATGVVEILEATFAAQPATRPRDTLRQRLSRALYDAGTGEVAAIVRDVTPVLLEALAEPNAARAELADALHGIAVGFEGEVTLVARRHDPGGDLALAELRAAILAQPERVLECLADEDARTRRATAMLVSALPELGARAVDALQDALRVEPDSLARYHLLYALARHGVRAEVPEAQATDHLASILTRVVRVLHGGAIDTTPFAAAAELPISATLLGGMIPGRAVIFANVGEVMRRGDPSALVPLDGGETVAWAVFAALWPRQRIPAEPRASLTDEEQRWIRPLCESGKLARTRVGRLDRAGFVGGVHVHRLVGLEAPGPADQQAGDVPLWLLARRVIDGHAPLDAWLHAVAAEPEGSVVAIVRDLDTYFVNQPWPIPYLDRMPESYEAHRRYFAVVRATFARLSDTALDAALAEPVAHAHATALAIRIDRGAEPGGEHDPLIAKLLAWSEVGADVVSLRQIVERLPRARRAAVLAGVRPFAAVNLATQAFLPIGLWFYADLAPPELLATLVADMASTWALATPKTPNEEAVEAAKRAAISSVFAAIGVPAVPVLRDALGARPSKRARVLLELALAATEQRDLAAAEPPGQRVKPRSPGLRPKPAAKAKAAKPRPKRSS
jgi:hypothetical protein